MTGSKQRALHVLAVDDEQPAVEQMRWLLEADPLVANVETATSVAQAKDLLRQFEASLDQGGDKHSPNSKSWKERVKNFFS